ncbi:MAG TPA: hypothetical protein VG737_13240 [Cyclobacteriaceae bacterium]|nr:hypothetical protein [Cyclobacteriaceae bacterium]
MNEIKIIKRNCQRLAGSLKARMIRPYVGLSFTVLLLIGLGLSQGVGQELPPVTNGWALFGGVKFTPKFYSALNESLLTPKFEKSILQYSGQEILLKGHYLPLDYIDPKVIVLSKVPNASCFFCGGAGPESVAEIHFKTKPPKFKADQIILVKGILHLNASDIEHMNFILKDVELISGHPERP